jgi:hypothetical protein
MVAAMWHTVRIVLLATAVLWHPAAMALTGEVAALSDVVVAQASNGDSRVLSLRSAIREGDLISTSDRAYARIRFSDQSEILVSPNSLVRIDTMRSDETQPAQDGFASSLIKGGLRAVTGLLARRNPLNYRLSTPTATIGIRGTRFLLLYCADDCAGIASSSGQPPRNGLHLEVTEGIVFARNSAGETDVGAGEFLFVPSLTMPGEKVTPANAIRLILPPQADGPVSLLIGPGRSGELECSVR